MVVSTLPELGMFDAASAPSVSSKKKQQPLQNAMIVDKIVEENEEEIEEGELVEEVYDNNVGHQSMMLLDEDESAATGSASSSSTSKKLNNEGIFDAKTSTLIEIPLAAAATATITAVEEHQRHEERMNHLLSSKNENIKKMMSSLSAKIGLSSTLAASASAQSRSVGTPLSAAVTMGSMATEVDSKSAPRIEKIMMMEMNAKSQESSTAVAAALASSLPKAVKSSGETLDMLVTSTTASDESTSSQKPSASLITAKKVSLGTLLFGDEFAQQSSGKCVSSTSTLPNACSKEDHMDEDVAIVAANSGSASTEDDRDSFYSAHGDSVDAVVNKMEEDRPASIASSTNATTSAVTSSIATTDNTILPSSSSISATLGTQHTIPSRVPGKVGKDLVDLNEKSTSIPPPSKAAASYDKNPLSHTVSEDGRLSPALFNFNAFIDEASRKPCQITVAAKSDW